MWFRMYSDDSLDEYDADNVEYLNEFDDSPLGWFSTWLIDRPIILTNFVN